MRETTTNIDLLNLSKKLHEVFETLHLEKRFQEVFSFVETITDQDFDMQNLTSENIQIWSQKFDQVLHHLFTFRAVDMDGPER